MLMNIKLAPSLFLTCFPLRGGVHLRRHVDEGDVEEHAAGHREDVLVGRLRLAHEDPDHQPDVARARRQEVVAHRLKDSDGETTDDKGDKIVR